MKSKELHQWVTQPEAYRDAAWEQEFFKRFQAGGVEVVAPTAQAGPDGWPYLQVRTAANATEPCTSVVQWLAEQGIGLAVNAHKEVPDYIFTYGMIWNFRERREFLTAAPERPNGPVEFKPGQKIWTINVDDSVLPLYVRKILQQFLADQQVLAAKVKMVSVDQKIYDLCFSLESLGNPPPREHRGVAEALSWFLPQHYSLLLVSEQIIPDFKPLV